MVRAMKKTSVLSFLFVVVLPAVAVIAEAQQPKKIPWVCYLIGSTASSSAESLKPFRERLRELGYIEGQNISMESRYWDGKIERLPSLAAELVRLNCDVILTTGTEAAEASKNATKAIPVVMAYSGDAVRLGIVADLARPGGNITGLTSINAELSGKRLELLKEVVPRLSRVALLWSPGNPNTKYLLNETESAASSLRVAIQSVQVKVPNDIEEAFQAATKKRAQALMLGGGGFLSSHQKRIVELAAKNRLPGVYPNVQYVEAGGLMTYTEDRSEMFRRAAEYVDKILKGTKPADLPVERPKKFELVINLKMAKQIGLTIPQKVLARADKVIK
jgi:putative tryptophan/tyrosine transport system substrate-binding protein